MSETLTLPAGLPPLPPVPDGFDRWVYLGRRHRTEDKSRLAFLYDGDAKWNAPDYPLRAVGDRCHYLEAVRSTPPAAEPAPQGCKHPICLQEGGCMFPQACPEDKQPPRQEGETPEIPATEGYPAGWMHCQIHLNPTSGEMHSDGDHRVRHWITQKLAEAKDNWERRDRIINSLNQNARGMEADIASLRERLDAAERRAADAEAELAKWRIISDGDTPEGASERLGEIKSKVESFIAMVEQPDTLPANARFVDKPHPDSLRLDWLEANQQTVWRVVHTENRATTDARGGRTKVEVFDGWAVTREHEDDPASTIRAAIDAAMSAPSAKGATP